MRFSIPWYFFLVLVTSELRNLQTDLENKIGREKVIDEQTELLSNL